MPSTSRSDMRRQPRDEDILPTKASFTCLFTGLLWIEAGKDRGTPGTRWTLLFAIRFTGMLFSQELPRGKLFATLRVREALEADKPSAQHV